MYADPNLHLHAGPEHNITFMNYHLDHPETGQTESAKFYRQMYNTQDGSIFVSSLRSPDAHAKAAQANNLPVAKLQELRRWSDVTFVMWKFLVVAGDRAKLLGGLRRIVHAVVSNVETLHTVQHVLELGGRFAAGRKYYPGYTYTRAGDGDCFAALLGTPNGMGTAFLLAQHRGELGLEVRSVQVFEESGHTYLVLNVGVKAAEKGTEKGTEKEVEKGAEKEVAKKTEK